MLSPMPHERCFEIDDPIDLKIAEVLLREQNKELLLKHMPPIIDAVVFDFDGVMTNNKVYVDEDGKETIMCDRSDGWGIAQLVKNGVRVFVLSSEINPVVKARCKKLNIECWYGLGESKSRNLKAWAEEEGIDLSHVIYVGNDDNDIGCLQITGYGIVPLDASPDAKNSASLVLESKGGDGAVRELCDLVMAKNTG